MMKLAYLANHYESGLIKGANPAHYYIMLRLRVATSRSQSAVIGRRDGCAVINPLALSYDIEDTRTPREWLLTDLRIIRACDVVYVPEDWRDGHGTRVECRWARLCGIEVRTHAGEVLYGARRTA